MADPISSTLMVTAMAGGTSLTASSQYAEGAAADKWAQYNAAVAESKARAESRVSRDQAKRHREDAERFKSQQRVAFAKSGVDMDSPSLLLVRADAAAELERDALLIEQQGKARSDYMLSEADMTRRQGKHQRRISRWQAGSSLLTGSANTYLQGREAGLF